MILERKVPGALSLDSPAIMLDPTTRQFHLAWHKLDTNELNWSMTTSPVVLAGDAQPEFKWTPPQHLEAAATDAGPALAAFEHQVWIAWKQLAPANAIWVASRDGTTWSVRPTQIPGASTDRQPCMVATPDALYVMWKGNGSDQTLHWSKSADGKIWTTPQRLADAITNWSPTVCFDNGTLYAAWTNPSQGAPVFWSMCSDGEHWTAGRMVPAVAARFGPAIATSASGHLTMVYQAEATNHGVWRTVLADAATNQWDAPAQVQTIAALSAPALASTELLMAWNGLRGSVCVGPALALGNDAPPTPDTQDYRFTFNSFQIEQTRARHNDTDFASMAVSVAGKPSTSGFKAMGDLNNGSYPVGLVCNVVAADTDSAVMTYSVINAGNSPPDTVESELVKAAKALAEAAAEKLESLVLASILDSSVIVTVFEMALPMIGTALDKLADWLVQQLVDVINANCDGPVAGSVRGFSGLDLRRMTASDKVWQVTDVNHGTPSADGCGPGTSLYNVTWSVEAI